MCRTSPLVPISVINLELEPLRAWEHTYQTALNALISYVLSNLNMNVIMQVMFCLFVEIIFAKDIYVNTKSWLATCLDSHQYSEAYVLMY